MTSRNLDTDPIPSLPYGDEKLPEDVPLGKEYLARESYRAKEMEEEYGIPYLRDFNRIVDTTGGNTSPPTLHKNKVTIRERDLRTYGDHRATRRSTVEKMIEAGIPLNEVSEEFIQQMDSLLPMDVSLDPKTGEVNLEDRPDLKKILQAKIDKIKETRVQRVENQREEERKKYQAMKETAERELAKLDDEDEVETIVHDVKKMRI